MKDDHGQILSCRRMCQGAGGGTYKATMASPPSHVVKQEKLETIEAVRKVSTQTGGHIARDNNPLGLPHGKDRKPIELGIVSLQGEEERERHVRCNILCTFLAKRPRLLHSFNGLSHAHQTLVLMLQEPEGRGDHSMKEWFLGASGQQRHSVWQAILSQEGAVDKIQKEGKLKYFE